jgi:actin-related protein
MSGITNSWKDSLNKRILLDNGAYHIKSSLATETKPNMCFNAVGKDKKSR